VRQVLAGRRRAVTPASHRAVGASGTPAATAAHARTPADHLKMPRMMIVLRRLLMTHGIDRRSGAQGSRTVVEMERHLAGHGDRAVVVTLRAHGLLSAQGCKSLIVVGHALGYRTGQMVVSEHSGRVRGHRFLTVAASADLISRVNLVTLWRLNRWERVQRDGRDSEAAMVSSGWEVVSSGRRGSIEEMLIVDVGLGLRGQTPAPRTRRVGVSVVRPELDILLARLLHLRAGL